MRLLHTAKPVSNLFVRENAFWQKCRDISEVNRRNSTIRFMYATASYHGHYGVVVSSALYRNIGHVVLHTYNSLSVVLLQEPVLFSQIPTIRSPAFPSPKGFCHWRDDESMDAAAETIR